MENLTVPIKERLLFQNDACFVINKLPGESSEYPAAWEKNKFPFPVHRLDMPVSGCLLLAKTREAAAFLGNAFARPAMEPEDGQKGEVEKLYWAIVEKPKKENPFPLDGELIHWLSENKKLNKSFAVPIGGGKHDARSKKAVMRYRITGEGDHYLFMEIDLVTGRHHQIRAQLAAIGLYIKGDLKYGAKRSEKTGGIRLHAFSLAFPNPLNPGEIIRASAGPPVMDSLWKAFADTADLTLS
jgi:23S rRNA pseudouridine1911/1915/1917 synthase